MEVQVIKADQSLGFKSKIKGKRLRVAAYCRVSTEFEDQLKSYDSMVQYYTTLIKKNPKWEFAGVYADRGITGTKVKNRNDFQDLIQACMEQKVDMIITKSIPRFARNTLDTLKYVRMLKEKGIAVYFEVEHINTLTDGEFFMTMYSSVAQQEVENTSAYVKKGLKMKMSRGEMIGFQKCLGYDYDPIAKKLVINEEEAEDIRYIFNRYIAGAGSTVIARELNEQGKRTIRGNPWVTSSVMGIITNEKYMGDLLQGKTFTLDPISKRRLNNNGEEDRYYIKDHHEAIISREVFEKAQEIRSRRNGNRKTATTGIREKFSRQYAFSCMMECGFCGALLSRRSWHSGSIHQKTVWQCVKATKVGKKACPESKGISEKVIEDAFIESYRMLGANNKEVLDEFLLRAEKVLSEDSTKSKLEKLQKKMHAVKSKRKKLLENFLEGVVSQQVYEEVIVDYEKEITSLEEKIEVLQQKDENETSLKKRIAEFRKVLSKNKVLEEFDRGVFESLIEKVIVGGYDSEGNVDPYKVTFIYKTGHKDGLEHAKDIFEKKDVCSNHSVKKKDVCSDHSDEKCGNRLSAFEETLIFCDLWDNKER